MLPLTLPKPVPETFFARVLEPLTQIYNSKGHAPLSGNQRSQLSLALACDLQVTDPALHPALHARHDQIATQAQADEYIKEVDNKISSKRLQ